MIAESRSDLRLIDTDQSVEKEESKIIYVNVTLYMLCPVNIHESTYNSIIYFQSQFSIFKHFLTISPSLLSALLNLRQLDRTI